MAADAPAQAPARWYLLRHAQPMIAPGICYGQLDVATDAAATAHAAAAFAAHWQSAHLQPASTECAVQLLASPLQRCQQLAQQVSQQLAARSSQAAAAADPAGVALHTHTGLAEIHFGEWEGVAWNALPSSAWQAWMSDFARYRPAGGESLAQLLQRVQAAAQHTAQWLRQHPQGVAVWVTHAGVMRTLHWLLQHGCSLPASADQWPQDGACEYGQWLALDETAVNQLMEWGPTRHL